MEAVWAAVMSPAHREYEGRVGEDIQAQRSQSGHGESLFMEFIVNSRFCLSVATSPWLRYVTMVTVLHRSRGARLTPQVSNTFGPPRHFMA